jgi:hypothetical protein
MTKAELEGVPWPQPDDPGRFLIHCSCGRWTFSGAAEEVRAAGRAHDDSPERSHIVSIRGRYRGRQ